MQRKSELGKRLSQNCTRRIEMHKGTILYVGGFELPDKNAAAHRVLSNAKIFRELGYNVFFAELTVKKSTLIM